MNEDQKITYRDALISLLSIQELCKNRGVLSIVQKDIDNIHKFMEQNKTSDESTMEEGIGNVH